MMKNATINFGSAVKALGNGKVAGHLVLYGDEKSADLAGEWFTAATDFDVELPGKSAVYFHHGLDPTVKKEKLGAGTLTVEEDEVGIWIEAQLDVRNRYGAAVYKLADEGALGWSSGTASHLTEVKATGEITRWPLGLDASLTPTPCDPRNLATVKASYLKSLPTFDELTGVGPALKSDGPSHDDRRRLLQKALATRLAADRMAEYTYAWVVDVFDATLVYEQGGRYFEAPYTMDGLLATIGEGVSVHQLTQYVASPAAKSTFGGSALGDPKTVPTDPTPNQLRAELMRERLKSMRPRTPHRNPMRKFKESPKLQALAATIAAKRAEIDKKYDVVLADGYEPTKEETEAVKTLNKEIEESEESYVALYELESGKSANAARLGDLKAPQRRGSNYDGDELPARSAKTLSGELMENEAFKGWIEGNKGLGDGGRYHSPRVGVKSLITGASETSAGAFVRREYDTTVPLPMRPLGIREIITVGGTESDLIEFVRHVSRTNNAAVVAEATATLGSSGSKPESGLGLETVEAVVKTIATWIPATRRAMADASQIRTLIDVELKDMVAQVLETQVVAGSGTGQNFLGLINTPGLTAQAFDTDILTTTRKGRTKCRVTGRAVPNAYLMSPLDWEKIDLLTDGEDRYYYGGPSALGTPRLWGVPIVEHEDMPEGRALLGDFKVATLWDRETAQIYVSDSHLDFFTRNLVAILCELRAAFGVRRPAAIVDVDLTA